MKIDHLSSFTPELTEFFLRLWDEADMDHYGALSHFTVERFLLVARDDELTNLGMINAVIQGGVVSLENLIVDKNYRNQGIGTALLEELEKVTKEKGGHKIYLYTTVGWEAVKLYEKMGYKKTADLPNHYLKKNWVEYTKFLDK